MDTEREEVSNLGSLPSADAPVFSHRELSRPGSPLVGPGPWHDRRESGRITNARSSGPSRQPSSNLELNKLAARIGTLMGQFNRRLAVTQDAQHLASFRLSEANQTHAAFIEAQARRLERQEQIVGDELETLHIALEHVTTESASMQAAVVARVGQDFQAQTAQHQHQAQVSSRLQAQDEEIRDRILAQEKLLKQAGERYYEQQRAHRSGMSTQLDKIKKARKETWEVAQRQSAAPTVHVTDEGEGPS